MSAKRRRSNRIPQSERVLLDIESPAPVKDIAVTVEVSAHGAKVLAKRRLAPDARGKALRLSAGREAPCRVVRQHSPDHEGRMETGLEIFTNTNFWGLTVWQSEAEPEPPPPPPPVPVAVAAQVQASLAELLEPLRSQIGTEDFQAKLWCNLVDALEAKGVFTRDELIGMLKQLGRG